MVQGFETATNSFTEDLGSKMGGFRDIVRKLTELANPTFQGAGDLLTGFLRGEANKLGSALQGTPTEDFFLRAPGALMEGFGDVPLSMGPEEATDLAMQFGPSAIGSIGPRRFSSQANLSSKKRFKAFESEARKLEEEVLKKPEVKVHTEGRSQLGNLLIGKSQDTPEEILARMFERGLVHIDNPDFFTGRQWLKEYVDSLQTLGKKHGIPGF